MSEYSIVRTEDYVVKYDDSNVFDVNVGLGCESFAYIVVNDTIRVGRRGVLSVDIEKYSRFDNLKFKKGDFPRKKDKKI